MGRGREEEGGREGRERKGGEGGEREEGCRGERLAECSRSLAVTLIVHVTLEFLIL